jgi:putative hydrolase of the HAD superfamily
MIDWTKITTVFLDLDGTLLDLRFDNHFWLEYVPQCYADKHGLDIGESHKMLKQKYSEAYGSLNWYCVEYWTAELELDIAALKQGIREKICVRPHVEAFLQSLHMRGKRVVLVTNAHQKALQLKMQKTALGEHLDLVISSHDIGLPKENPVFWQRLQQQVHFDSERTLFVDDSLPVLDSARAHGIRYLLHVLRPDTRQPPRQQGPYPAVTDFGQLAW